MSDYIFMMYLNNHPSVNRDDIEYWFRATTYDIFIKFKNGKKILYQLPDDYERILPYENEELTDEEFKYEFGLRLKRFMRLRYFNQGDLAKIIGTSQTMISLYVNGEVMPNGNMMNKIAKALKLPLSDFYYREQ